MDFLDLFCGAGGLSLGLEAAGFRCAAAVEVDRDACDTFAASHPEAQLLDVDVARLDFAPFRGIPLLAGGPPCQPFSAGGKGMAAGDSRDMLPHFVRAVREAKPSAFLMENVPGLAGPAHRQYLARVLGELALEEYKVSAELLNAAEYGVPQKRKRLIVVGVRETHRSVLRFPAPTHGPRGAGSYVSARSAIRGVNTMEPNESKVTYAKRPDLRPSPYDGHLFNAEEGRSISMDPRTQFLRQREGTRRTLWIRQAKCRATTATSLAVVAPAAVFSKADAAFRSKNRPRSKPSPTRCVLLDRGVLNIARSATRSRPSSPGYWERRF